MGWYEVGEVIKAVAPIFTASAACVGAYIGFKGLERWRTETIGKQRIELAQEALADFYEAVDILSWVRSPAAFGHEMEARPGRQDDPENVRRHRDTYYPPVKRLVDHAEFFARLRARRYKMIANYGKDAGNPYDKIHDIHSRIFVAAQLLMRAEPRVNDDRAWERQQEREDVIWEGGGEHDQIAEELKILLAEVEGTYRNDAARISK